MVVCMLQRCFREDNAERGQRVVPFLKKDLLTREMQLMDNEVRCFVKNVSSWMDLIHLYI